MYDCMIVLLYDRLGTYNFSFCNTQTATDLYPSNRNRHTQQLTWLNGRAVVTTTGCRFNSSCGYYITLHAYDNKFKNVWGLQQELKIVKNSGLIMCENAIINTIIARICLKKPSKNS